MFIGPYFHDYFKAGILSFFLLVIILITIWQERKKKTIREKKERRLKDYSICKDRDSIRKKFSYREERPSNKIDSYQRMND